MKNSHCTTHWRTALLLLNQFSTVSITNHIGNKKTGVQKVKWSTSYQRASLTKPPWGMTEVHALSNDGRHPQFRTIHWYYLSTFQYGRSYRMQTWPKTQKDPVQWRSRWQIPSSLDHRQHSPCNHPFWKAPSPSFQYDNWASSNNIGL